MKRKNVGSGVADTSTNKVKFANAREDMKRKTVNAPVRTGAKADGKNLKQNIRKKMIDESKNQKNVMKVPRKVLFLYKIYVTVRVIFKIKKRQDPVGDGGKKGKSEKENQEVNLKKPPKKKYFSLFNAI